MRTGFGTGVGTGVGSVVRSGVADAEGEGNGVGDSDGVGDGGGLYCPGNSTFSFIIIIMPVNMSNALTMYRQMLIALFFLLSCFFMLELYHMRSAISTA